MNQKFFDGITILGNLKGFIRFFACLIIVCMHLNCKKQDRGFQMIYRSLTPYNISIGLDPFASHYYTSDQILSDTVLFFPANNVTAAQVGRITPYTMNIRASFQDGRYDFVSHVEVSIFDPARPNTTEQIIFYNDNVPVTTGTQINLVPNDVDVTPFLVKGKSFVLRTKFQFRDTPQRTIATEWNASFFARY